jgi:chromosome segregation ATPase
MFSFESLELMNWDLWEHVRVPLDEQVVMIAGPNGSGKTTFLDSIRILLGARTLSTSRKLGSYLRGDTGVAVVKAVVSNPLRKGFGKRPFTHRGIFEEQATLACIIERKSGNWQRRYVIAPGDASLDAIKAWPSTLTPEEYAADLQKANLPRTLLKILALEQGETNKLSRRTPSQLLEYVLELQGDKEVMANYARAREAYAMSAKELAEQEEKAYDARRHLQHLEHQARSYEQFRDLTREQHDIREVRLPLARYRTVREQRRELEASVIEARETMAAREAESAGLLGDSQRALDEIRRLQEGVQVKRREQQEVLDAKESIDGEYRTVRNRLRELEELKSKLGPADEAQDPQELEQKRRNFLVAEASSNAEIERARQELVALRGEKRKLEGGSKPEPPSWVSRMGEALSERGIRGVLALDVIEIRDPKWQVAVESLLGRDRFTWIVPPEDSLAARQLAQQLRYPCYVSELEDPQPVRAKPGTALSQVVLADDRIPRWLLSQLDRVQLVETVAEGVKLGKDAISITPDGYRQDPRGGVFIGVGELFCGGHARHERLLEIDRKSAALLDTIREREEMAARVRRSLAQVEQGLERERERARFLAREAELPDLVRRSDELSELKRQKSQKLMDAMTEVDALNAGIHEREKEIGLSDYKKKLIEQERQRAQADLQQRTARMRRLDSELEEMERLIPPDHRSEGALALEESEAHLLERLKVLDDSVASFPGCTDSTVLEVFEKARADFDGHQRILQQRRSEHRRGELELQRARKSYVRVIEQTIARYRRNILELARKAGVEVEVHVPRIGDDDEALKAAGIEIRIGFDGKKPVPINHPKLSGGQSVIASLMLLMALTMQDEGDVGGFFILDEPFAHLSVERIDDITSFLMVTRAQFILTTPTTHNLMVYNPARLTLNLRKKPSRARFAPVPTFLRR